MQIQQADNTNFLRDTQLVQSNTQYLTLVRSLATHQARSQHQCMRTLETYMENHGNDSKAKLNYEMLCQLMIELGYFLFACRSFGLKPLIEMTDIKIEESYQKSNEKMFGVIIFYKLDENPMEENEGVMLYHGIFEHIETNLASILQNRQGTSSDEYQVTFDAFCQQYKTIAGCGFFQSNQVQVFQALEQTNLFYEHSWLYRIKNCSMVEFIRSNPAKMIAFKAHKKKDLEYNQDRKNLKNDLEGLRNKEKQIYDNLLKFFNSIKEQDKHFRVETPKSQKQSANKISFVFVIQERHKTPLETILEKFQGQENAMSEEGGKNPIRRPPSKMKFYIEYSLEKNLICVRLMLPSIKFIADTSDFLMFQSNVLTFQACSITIQLSDDKDPEVDPKTNKTLPPQKIVNFKGTSSFNVYVKEPPLEKILLLMDMTMIASRLYEPELNSNKFDIYHKVTTISRRTTHYTKLLMRLGKKIYAQ